MAKGDVPESGLTHLRVTLAADVYLGPGRADLLELIDKTGSISAAAREMGMSYRRAWMLVRVLNEGFDTVLVDATRGGSGQGGAVLTDLGQEVLKRYRHMEQLAGDSIAEDVVALRARMKPSSK